MIFDAEHFFDGFRANPEYALDCLKAAQEGGADWIVLCDTNGGRLPGDIRDALSHVNRAVKTPLGIHCHNDGELAVANTLAGVEMGVRPSTGHDQRFWRALRQRESDFRDRQSCS